MSKKSGRSYQAKSETFGGTIEGLLQMETSFKEGGHAWLSTAVIAGGFFVSSVEKWVVGLL